MNDVCMANYRGWCALPFLGMFHLQSAHSQRKLLYCLQSKKGKCDSNVYQDLYSTGLETTISVSEKNAPNLKIALNRAWIKLLAIICYTVEATNSLSSLLINLYLQSLLIPLCKQRFWALINTLQISVLLTKSFLIWLSKQLSSALINILQISKLLTKKLSNSAYTLYKLNSKYFCKTLVINYSILSVKIVLLLPHLENPKSAKC